MTCDLLSLESTRAVFGAWMLALKDDESSNAAAGDAVATIEPHRAKGARKVLRQARAICAAERADLETALARVTLGECLRMRWRHDQIGRELFAELAEIAGKRGKKA